MNIYQWESYVLSGCCVYSQSIKCNSASTIQSIVCNCFNKTKGSFCVNMWQWRKHGSATSLQSQTGSQMSRQQQLKAGQSNHRHEHSPARFWPPYFEMHKVFCSSITLRKEQPSIADIILHYWCIWRKKLPKKCHKWRKKVLFHQGNAPCHKLITTMAKLHELHFELLPQTSLFSRSGPSNFWLFCRPQKNTPGKRFSSN